MRCTSASTHSCIRRSRVPASCWLGGPAFQRSDAAAIGPPPRGQRLPPIETRSFIRVTMAPRQPSPTSPRRSASGMRTSVKKTSLNSASPVIWRSGRTSTPGRVHVDDEVGEALVLLGLGVGAGQQHPEARRVGEGRPHLLAVEDPLVAVAHGPGGQAGHVGSGARLGEQLAPDLLAGEQRAQIALPLVLGSRGQDGRSGHAVPDRVARWPAIGAPACAQPVGDQRLQLPGQTQAPVAGREVDEGQAGVELGAQELAFVGRAGG